MNETSPLSLALFDFFPNLLFLAGAFSLVRLALLVRSRPCGRMAMAGTLLVFLGGFLKATWKLLYTAGLADLQILSQAQFVLLAPGFLAMFVTVLLLARGQKKGSGMLLAMAPWKIPFLIVMTLASMGAYGMLTYVAFRRGARLAAAGFIVAFLVVLAMGGMASSEQTLAKQWIEEITNTCGQLGFALGSFLLYQNFKKDPCA